MCSQRVQGFKGSSEMLKNYKGLKVWQKSYELCLEIYRITAKFPRVERYGLISQIRRSVVSIPSNIANWKSELGSLKKDIAEIERMLKALIKSLEKNLWILGPSSQTILEKNHFLYPFYRQIRLRIKTPKEDK